MGMFQPGNAGFLKHRAVVTGVSALVMVGTVTASAYTVYSAGAWTIGVLGRMTKSSTHPTEATPTSGAAEGQTAPTRS